MQELKEIMKRANSAIADYNNLMGMACESTKLADLKKQIYMTVISINILEAVRFYVSFICSFAFAENKKTRQPSTQRSKERFSHST